MAFAVHINKEHCTGCKNCVVACPLGERGIHSGPALAPAAEVQ